MEYMARPSVNRQNNPSHRSLFSGEIEMNKHLINLVGRRIVFMAKPYIRLLSTSPFSTSAFSSASKQWNGGVSMVQGASRGIGLEFVKQLLERKGEGRVIATCRNPNGAAGLLELKDKFSDRLDIHPLDLTIESTVEESANAVRDKYGSLNLLINASGILSIPDILQPETTLTKVQRSSMLLAYDINAVGPILVIKVPSLDFSFYNVFASRFNKLDLAILYEQHMWPLLKAGGGCGTGRDFAIVANLSARVGSIGDNTLGGWHSYRSSKTALNQCTVDTDLSKPFQKNVAKDKLFTKEFSVQKLLSIIDNAKRTDNGKFFAWDGQSIPW
nr:C-factor-like isoform X1 [Ipomoea batatas]